VFLAEQKMEQIKAWALSKAPGQGFASIMNGNPSTADCCSAEGYNQHARLAFGFQVAACL